MRSDQLVELLNPDVWAIQKPIYERHLELFEKARGWDTLNQLLYLDMKTYMVSPNLTYTDKTSMAHSVEVRVPFLDLEILNLVRKIPPRLKANFHQTKILMKSFSESILPAQIIHRRKSGFGIPLRDWLLKDLQQLTSDLLSESRLAQHGLFNPAVVSRLLKEHREKNVDHTMKLYSLMTFQLWYETFNVR